MKRKVWILVAVCAAILAFGCTAALAIGGARRGTSGTLSDTIRWTLDEDGVLTVEGSGAIPDYWDYNPSPFAENDQITSVKIGEGITVIGDRMFMDDPNLLSVSIPTSLKTIGYCAFCRTGLQGVVIPADVTIIGEGAFYHCPDLWNVTVLPYSTEVYEDTFNLCDDDLVIHGWTGSGAEAYCTEYGITFEAIRESGECGGSTTWTLDPQTGALRITGTGAIRSNAFEWNEAIRSVTIGSGVTKIGSCAFLYCTRLTGATLPAGLKTIDEGAFHYCSGLKAVTIPDSVTGIQEGAFWGCTSLEKFSLPKGLSSLGGYVLCGCSSLTEVTLPEDLTAIPGGFFQGCSGLKKVEIPKGVTRIEGHAFSGCAGLEEMVIPSGVTFIGECAFIGCEGLSGVTLPRDTGDIRDGAFYGCKKLEDVTVLNPEAEFSEDVFTACSSDLTLYGWKDSTLQTYAGRYGLRFAEISPAADFVLPKDLTEIGAEAFSKISAKAVVIPKGVTKISGNPFAGSQVQVIYGCPGSAAETFAEEYGYLFVAMEE